MSTTPTNEDRNRTIATWLSLADNNYLKEHPKKVIDTRWNRFCGLCRAIAIRARALGDESKIVAIIRTKLRSNEISSTTLRWFKDKTIEQVFSHTKTATSFEGPQETRDKVTGIMGKQLQEATREIYHEDAALEAPDELLYDVSLQEAQATPRYKSVLSPSERLKATSSELPRAGNDMQTLRMILCIDPQFPMYMDLKKVPHRDGIQGLITSFTQWHGINELARDFDSFDPMAQLYLYERCPPELEDELIAIITKNIDLNHTEKGADFYLYLDKHKNTPAIQNKYERLLEKLKKYEY